MKIDPRTGNPIGLKDHYIGIFQTLAQAPENQLTPFAAEWFGQFDEKTWESEEHFIREFNELAQNFAILAEDCRANGWASAFVIDSFMTISIHMLDDLRELALRGYFDKPN
jgi:hypothetical protein